MPFNKARQAPPPRLLCVETKDIIKKKSFTIQSSLMPVTIDRITPSTNLGLNGALLKWVAHGDDGDEYAMKTLVDHPLLPLTR